ncbi:unnamed protein product [Vicia faba]|uniref:Uncharacterized protein n=1 Tax=Vicia faba TaxID=3906 RepID=A0AAV1B596_VICFA|nr:unnamed protein product [Vicia faba]
MSSGENLEIYLPVSAARECNLGWLRNWCVITSSTASRLNIPWCYMHLATKEKEQAAGFRRKRVNKKRGKAQSAHHLHILLDFIRDTKLGFPFHCFHAHQSVLHISFSLLHYYYYGVVQLSLMEDENYN